MGLRSLQILLVNLFLPTGPGSLGSPNTAGQDCWPSTRQLRWGSAHFSPHMHCRPVSPGRTAGEACPLVPAEAGDRRARHSSSQVCVPGQRDSCQGPREGSTRGTRPCLTCRRNAPEVFIDPHHVRHNRLGSFSCPLCTTPMPR